MSRAVLLLAAIPGRCRVNILMRTERFLRAVGIMPSIMALVLASCASSRMATRSTAAQPPALPAYASTYRPRASARVLITDATVLTGTGDQLDKTSLLLGGGRIEAVGPALAAPEGTTVIDGKGKWITPGLIDVHAHLGLISVLGYRDLEETSDPNTAQAWVEHGVWPQDPQFALALAGGVTTLQLLPGSGNLFGGRSVTVRNLPAPTIQAMKFPGAPYGLKMACGENPPMTYGPRNQSPMTRMAVIAGQRQAWADALQHGGSARRDLQMETLLGALRGEILVHVHCYRSEEMAVMLDMAREFGFRIAAFHHAIEAYKVAGLLAKSGTCAAVWPEWWGFKAEAYDMVEENAAMVDAAGGCAVLHSDSGVAIQHLNQEAARAMAAGNAAGFPVTRAQAIRWITSNAAHALGIADRTGALEPGKMADVVVWSGDPFSVYTTVEKVFMDGALVYDRNDARTHTPTDFSLGLPEAPELPQ
jgi:imidazolonepropionase-like amidohydrolase